jgi:hypothetical protein
MMSDWVIKKDIERLGDLLNSLQEAMRFIQDRVDGLNGRLLEIERKESCKGISYKEVIEQAIGVLEMAGDETDIGSGAESLIRQASRLLELLL